jgi:glutaminase
MQREADVRARTADPEGRPGAVASPFQEHLEALHARYRGLEDGDVARYIPELAKADPSWFGIAVATIDGHVYEVGDSRQPFTIQSISKPFTYGLALEDQGAARVLAKIGVEPTGDAFNAISLAPESGCPLNPMINAGAIASASLVAGRSEADRLERLLAVYSAHAGRRLAIDAAVFESERATGHRNRAIGHMLRNFEIVDGDPDPALTLYFQQCSVAVECRDLAVMAATLANAGRNPLTGERALRADLVESVLSVMTTCGMYDASGEWVYAVGLPAKSGVGGGVLAVLPGQLGIGVFSPRLDARGNSVRGVAVCKDLSREFQLHFLRVPSSARSVPRAQYSLARVGSKRQWRPADREVLDRRAERVQVYEMQGDLGFAAAETLVRRIVAASPELEVAVVDLSRVTAIDACAVRLVQPLVEALGRRDKQLVLVGVDAHPAFLRGLQEGLSAGDQWGRLVAQGDLDAALEWCERRLLARDSRGDDAPALPLAEHEVCRGLDAAQVDRLAALLEPLRFARGSVIVRRDEPADRFFLLTRGRVSVTVETREHRRRLTTLSPGMPFGELAVVARTLRTADVRADTDVECFSLAIDRFDRLGETDPAIKLAMLENLLRRATGIVARLSLEVATLAR